MSQRSRRPSRDSAPRSCLEVSSLLTQTLIANTFCAAIIGQIPLATCVRVSNRARQFTPLSEYLFDFFRSALNGIVFFGSDYEYVSGAPILREEGNGVSYGTEMRGVSDHRTSTTVASLHREPRSGSRGAEAGRMRWHFACGAWLSRWLC